MPPYIQNEWTIKKLLTNTFMHQRNRYENKDRDVIQRIKIKKISSYDLTTRKKRTKFVVETTSYPQYNPYYTKEDARGRTRTYQRTYSHHYDVTIQLDRLSLNVPVRIRTGADRPWDFTPRGKSKKVNGRIQEGTNVKNGINGDFFFRLSYIRKQAGLLYGRNYANAPPVKMNPNAIQFLTKHELHCIEILMNQGYLKDD